MAIPNHGEGFDYSSEACRALPVQDQIATVTDRAILIRPSTRLFRCGAYTEKFSVAQGIVRQRTDTASVP